MKRYLLFSGPDYYPNGGAGDFAAACDSVEEAEALLVSVDRDHIWAHLFDLTTLDTVVDWGRSYDRTIQGLTAWTR